MPPTCRGENRVPQRSIRSLVLVLGLTLALPAVAKPKAPDASKAKVAPPPASPAPPAPAGNPGDPQTFVSGLHTRLEKLSKSIADKPALHKAIAAELQGVVDWPEMARLALASRWEEVNEAQRKEFTDLLSRMVQNSYVKRFEPGTAVTMALVGSKALDQGRMRVTTRIQVRKTSAEVAYLLRPVGGRWMAYDIVVDDASQVQSYRQSFKKILDKEGWTGLIARMKKAADKKTG